jgi:hypothetical protein
VVAREVNDKATMTVAVDGGTRDVPVPGPLRTAPVLTDAQATALAWLANAAEAVPDVMTPYTWSLVRVTRIRCAASSAAGPT